MESDGIDSMTALQLSEKLRASERHVRNETKAGRIPHYRVGRLVRYSKAAIEEWIASKTVGAK